MVSSIRFGVVSFGVFFSLLVLIFRFLSGFLFLRHNGKYHIHVKLPALAHAFHRCACESEGVASSLSIVARDFPARLSSKGQFHRRCEGDFPSSTICKIGGISSVRRIKRWTVILPTPKPPLCRPSATSSQLVTRLSLCGNPAASWLRISSCRQTPRSDGRIFSRCKLLSTRVMMARSRSKGRTNAGTVFIPASSDARTPLPRNHFITVPVLFRACDYRRDNAKFLDAFR